MINAPRLHTNNRENNNEFSLFSDPALLIAARQIYQAYFETHPKQVRLPIGVVIHRVTYRGKLIFSEKPILLPQETFVSVMEMESEE